MRFEVRRLLLSIRVLCLAALAGAQAHHTPPPSSIARDPMIDAAFERFYNMDYERSTRYFEQILERHPSDPSAVNHLLNAVLMHELYRMGAMNSGEYANDSFIGQAHHPADPNVKQRIQQLVARAQGLEEQQLKANSNDVSALYARGITRAEFSLYTALVERAWVSALRNAVGARHDHERVLQLNPNYVEAKLVVGAHNYVMGSLPWSAKVAVSLVRLSGSREKGLQYLREAATGTGENNVDAKIVLSLFLRRDHNYDEARGIMHELSRRYPRNYLFSLEEANLLRASGNPQAAASIYRQVWQSGRAGRYGTLHYETAASALGDLLRSQKDYGGAAAAYELVNDAPNPDPETLQKANLAAGEMYDLLQRRDLAMKKYQIVLAQNAATPPAEQARKHIREAYRE